MEKLTIKDIARMANVSPASVSRVINNIPYGISEDTRKRVAAIIKESGYQPNTVARSMVTKRSTTIGLLVPDITNQFYALLVKGVEDIATRRGYSVVLCNSNNNDEKEFRNLSFLKENYVAGIIYNNFKMIDKIRKVLEDIHVPVIYVDNIENVKDAFSLHVRQKEGMAMMTRYLLEMGHTKFAYLAGPEEVLSASQRLEGFREVLEEKGIRIPESFIKSCEYSENGGYEAAKELMGEKKEFTCLVCANDLIAYGATRLFNERGIRIPQDISVTGFDDIPFSKLLNPALTTVYNPVQDMGRRAAELLLECLEGKHEGEKGDIPFEPVLVKRESVRFMGEW